jgi:hypothetical protein
MNAGTEREFHARLERLDALLRNLEPNDEAHQVAQLVLDLHGAALERLTDRLKRSGTAGQAILIDCSADPLIGSLLILHGLHPHDLGTRVQQALETARSTLQMHGMGARLLSLLDGVAHVRIEVIEECDEIVADEVRAAIEAAIAETAPDLSAVEFSGLPAASGRRALVALPLVTAS